MNAPSTCAKLVVDALDGSFERCLLACVIGNSIDSKEVATFFRGNGDLSGRETAPCPGEGQSIVIPNVVFAKQYLRFEVP